MRNVQREIREVLKEVAAETGQEFNVVEDIYFHEFEFLADQMASGERNNYPTFQNILLKHFGSFIANEKHVNKLKQIEDEKREKSENNSE